MNKKQIKERLEAISISEMELEPRAAKDVAFHMTDWLDDLAAFSAFCNDPARLSNNQLADLLLAFLQHVPNHVAAAAKLYADCPVEDIFGVGAISKGA